MESLKSHIAGIANARFARIPQKTECRDPEMQRQRINTQPPPPCPDSADCRIDAEESRRSGCADETKISPFSPNKKRQSSQYSRMDEV
jgi:hypothetical protein